MSPGKNHLEKSFTTKGETNCPRYKLAETRGITVVTASLPPFIEAIVLMYGTPIPFAIPPSNKAIIVAGNEGDKMKPK